MISIVHWLSTKRRLEEQNKTVHMMGGETECPPMLLAQREMTQHELEYYKEQMVDLLLTSIQLTSIMLLLLSLYVLLHDFGVI